MRGCEVMAIKDNFIENVNRVLKSQYAKTLKNAEAHEKYYAIGKAIMAMISDDWIETQKRYEDVKQACYFSAEYLMGRALGNNLINLSLYDEVKDVLDKAGFSLEEIENAEADAGLGNGGLGRLAAGYLDSSATCNLPLTGYGIRYEYGIFEQKIINGFQVEKTDNWLEYDDPWFLRMIEDSIIVQYSDSKVRAVPYDTPIIGYKSKSINRLRLWKSEPIEDFDFGAFNDQKYDLAVSEKNRAKDISRILYPNDSHREGKLLRLRQQYFFVSASLMDMVRKFKHKFGKEFIKFPDYHVIQLNDTHPVVAIPELMRILMDEEGLTWDEAWNITIRTFAYTNHTILSEALEKWNVDIFRELLPRIYEIIECIDRKFLDELNYRKVPGENIESMKIISNHQIHMAWLAIFGSFSINGVAYLHTEILKRRELKNWYALYPDKFHNVTNGITPRRWMVYSNEELSSLITELLGNRDWVANLEMLKKLENYKDHEDILKRFIQIKHKKKQQLAEHLKAKENVIVEPNSIFDIHVKRIHEYKRQLLNAFHILYRYYKIKENPNINITPVTYIIGGKAAPGYFRAKAIIKYINEVAHMVNNDEEINSKIKVIFIQNYNVTYAEKLFPAADVSEQISTAGKEASGTGNMKLMLNGTPTIGTFDGANVEIVEEAGWENNFIFGANVEELEKLYSNYNPKQYYENVPGLKRVVDTLVDGTFNDGGTGMFKELFNALLQGTHWHMADHYFILKDFESYALAHEKINEAYGNEMDWARKCWINMCNSGKFSSDRSIKEYAHVIWKIEEVK